MPFSPRPKPNDQPLAGLPLGRIATATHVVPAEAGGPRLDAYAAAVFEELPSRQSAKKALKRGDLLLNGGQGQPHQPVEPGQLLELLLPTSPLVPIYVLHFPVVLEDDCLAVVHKPPGIPVSGNYARTIQRALPANLRSSTARDALPWPRPVHRLDAPTGGLLLVAKTASALVGLSRQFQQRHVHKHYRAVVEGRLDGEDDVNTPIEAMQACTHYRGVGHTRSLHTGWVTTVDLWPRTGRTHQLRRHMTWLGHPVVGDSCYGDSGRTLRGKGLFLWAVGLRLTHPHTGVWLDVHIDEPPKFHSYRQREARRWEAHQCAPFTTASEGQP